MNIMQMYQLLRQNPMTLLCKRFNIPNTVDINNPNAIIQHLLNTGQVTQNAVNNAMQMQNNPIVRQFFNNKL